MAASASKYTLITGLIREDLSLTLRPRTPGQMFSRRVSKQPRRVQSCGVPSCVVPLSVFTFIQSRCSETREKERGVKDGLSSSPAARIPHVTAVSHTSALQVLHRITKWKVGRDHRGSSGPTSLLSQALPRAHCIQTVLEHLQWERFHSHSGQPAPVHSHQHSKVLPLQPGPRTKGR